MPTYEYACRDCGEHVEVVQSFRDDPLTTCGLCGGTLRKVFGAAGIIFRGSGYYVTDSRKKPAEPAASESKADAGSRAKSESGAKSESAAKSKSAAKSESAAESA
ncbi:MAG TPA: FmdB family zinc ribbon protein [Egibacteraceae bacterium]|nr:FmdB family transcriptional regulator [Actinomycetota bacterium]HWB73163.1 FmdB family zinc ribbon protein [Egibacteraceae bacterium]